MPVISLAAEAKQMEINGVACTFHHMGIPTTERKPQERFNEQFGMYTSDSGCNILRTQWHRFEPDSSLHILIRTVPHVAFKVQDLDRAILGSHLLLGPYEPIPGFRVAMIEDAGQPIEFVQTTLTDEELWAGVAEDEAPRHKAVTQLRSVTLARHPRSDPGSLHVGSHTGFPAHQH